MRISSNHGIRHLPSTPAGPFRRTSDAEQEPAQPFPSRGKKSTPVLAGERFGCLLVLDCSALAVGEPDVGGEHRGYFQGIHSLFLLGVFPARRRRRAASILPGSSDTRISWQRSCRSRSHSVAAALNPARTRACTIRKGARMFLERLVRVDGTAQRQRAACRNRTGRHEAPCRTIVHCSLGKGRYILVDRLLNGEQLRRDGSALRD